MSTSTHTDAPASAAQTLRCSVVWRAARSNKDKDAKSDGGSGDDGVAVPLELRWGVDACDVRAMWQLSEASFAVGYNADYYESLVGPTWLSLLAYTTPAAYAAVERAAQQRQQQQDGDDDKDKQTTATAARGSGDLDEALRKHSVDVAIAQLEERARTQQQQQQSSSTSSSAATTTAHDTKQATSLALSLRMPAAVWRHIRAVVYRAVVAPTAAVWHVVSSVTEAVAGTAGDAVTKGAAVASASAGATLYIAQHTTTLTNTTAAATDEDEEGCTASRYSVLVGFVVGTLAYAECVVQQPQPQQRALSLLSSTSSAVHTLCVNPTGYIASFCVAPRLRGCGVGQALLTHYLHYMTHDMPLHASAYLHKDDGDSDDKAASTTRRTRRSLLQRLLQAGQTRTPDTSTTTTTAAEASRAAEARTDANADIVQYGVDDVWLHCLADDASPAAFYTHRGFRVLRRLAAFYRFDDVDHAALLLLYTPPATTRAHGSNNNSSNSNNSNSNDSSNNNAAPIAWLTPSLYASVSDVVHDTVDNCRTRWRHLQQQQERMAVRAARAAAIAAELVTRSGGSSAGDEDTTLQRDNAAKRARKTAATTAAAAASSWGALLCDVLLTVNAIAVLGVVVWYCIYSDALRW